MRVSCPVAVVLAVAALTPLLAPSPAAAQEPLACRPAPAEGGAGPIAARFLQLSPHEAVHDALGDAQDAEVQLDAGGTTWSAGVAPGPLSLDAARGAIEARLRQVFAGADADFLVGTMRVVAQPFAVAHLRTVQRTLLGQLHLAGLSSWSLSRTCRVTITLHTPNGEPERVRAQQVAAPYGDAVRVVLASTPGPQPIATAGLPASPGAPAPGGSGAAPAAGPGATAGSGTPTAARRTTVSLWKVVRVPVTRRCVHRRAVSVRPRDGVVQVLATVGVRSAAATDGEALRVRLRGRTTTVRLRVRTEDDRTARRTLTYRRCAAGRDRA